LQAAYPIAAYGNDSQLTYETLCNDIIYCGGVHNLRALSSSPAPHLSPIYHHLIHYHPTPPTAYLGTRAWLTSHAGHEWDQLLLLRTFPASYTATRDDEAHAELLRRVWVDGMVTNGGMREGGGFWTPFNAEWLEGGEGRDYTYSASFRQYNEDVDVVADLRWEKCQLLDRLGFAHAGWAN